MELKPTNHVVVNYNFTYTYSMKENGYVLIFLMLDNNYMKEAKFY